MMRYEFAQDMTLDEVRSVINEHNEKLGTKVFIEADRGDHVIFNYLINFDGVFELPNTGDPVLDRKYAILRECRGLTFCKQTGRVVTRKYAKFFNLNERPETQHHLIDWALPHIILEKLDGSMITPMYVGDLEDIGPEKLRWCTKMGETDVAKPVLEWLKDHEYYSNWAAHTIYAGYTPIFEWCSRQQRIVIDYPEDRLVLTAIRNNKTGKYLPYSALQAAERSQIEIVRALPGSVENIEQFMAEVRDIKGMEGYVIRFDDGHMLKIKAMEYCLLHGMKDKLNFEKNVLSMIFEEVVDDAKAFMDDNDRTSVEMFETALNHAISNEAKRLTDLTEEGRRVTEGNKKLFATDYMKSISLAPQESGVMFKIFDGYDGEECVRRVIAAHLSTGPRVDSVRHLFGGLRWEDFRKAVYLDD